MILLKSIQTMKTESGHDATFVVNADKVGIITIPFSLMYWYFWVWIYFINWKVCLKNFLGSCKIVKNASFKTWRNQEYFPEQQYANVLKVSILFMHYFIYTRCVILAVRQTNDKK